VARRKTRGMSVGNSGARDGGLQRYGIVLSAGWSRSMTPRNRITALARSVVRAIVPVLGALALLAGCASTLTSEVTSFHRLGNGLSGERFVIVPSESQAGSLEFETYAGFVRQALVGHGLLDGGVGERAGALMVRMG